MISGKDKTRLDLHIHTSTGSDGACTVEEVFAEAGKRCIGFMSITDHDSVAAQERAVALAAKSGIIYVTGVELNVTFTYPPDGAGKSRSVSLDFLGYGYDRNNAALLAKLELMRERRESRARQIMERLNAEFTRTGIQLLTEDDIRKIQENAEGAFGRPHIAAYLVVKGIVRDQQEAFDKYLVRLDVPKYPLTLAEASQLVRDAGGILVMAHPNDSHGTSLFSLTKDLAGQAKIIEEHMLGYIDGIECWHSRHDPATTAFYLGFARKHNLMVTGGSDCHQKPVILGTLDIPEYVAAQFTARFMST